MRSTRLTVSLGLPTFTIYENHARIAGPSHWGAMCDKLVIVERDIVFPSGIAVDGPVMTIEFAAKEPTTRSIAHAHTMGLIACHLTLLEQNSGSVSYD